MSRTVLVIGGGAAGLMAAVMAARAGAAVTVLEQNEKPGKKILASGNGRCNYTNRVQKKECYRGCDPEYAWKILRQFSADETLHFFEQLGIYPKERNGWLYPNSDQAQSVLEVLLMEAAHLKIKIKTRETVLDLYPDQDGWTACTATWKYHADAVIVASGSPASNVEGASDWGFLWAKGRQIPVAGMLPALVGLKGKGNYFSRWSGVRVFGKVSVQPKGMETYTEEGELQLTEYGISGIPIFQISRYVLAELQTQSTALLELDFMPSLTEGELRILLEEREECCPYKTLQEQFVGLLPSKLISIVAPAESNLRECVHNCKHYPLIVTGASSLRQAQVCSGGVLTDALDEHLQAKEYPNLYFAGELVDVDGACGGYNLQWAWSSGAVAGRSAAEESL